MANCAVCGNELPDGAKFCPRCGAPVTNLQESVSAPSAGAPAQPATASGPVLAFWWERFAAWLIDVVLITVITFIVNLLIGFTFNVIPGWPDWLPFFNFNLDGLLLFLYWMLMEGSSGMSLGKSVMRVRVVHVDGTPINMGEAAVESVGKAFLLPLDLLLGWILYPRRRQRIFNYLSRTIVIKTS